LYRLDREKLARLAFSVFFMGHSKQGIALKCNNGSYDINKPISAQVPISVEAFAWTVLCMDHQYLQKIPYAETTGIFVTTYKQCLYMVTRCRAMKDNGKLEADVCEVSLARC